MPTVCKIRLDASDYREELQAVLAESRAASAAMVAGFQSASAAMGAGFQSASAAAQDLADTLDSLSDARVTDQQYKVTGAVDAPEVPQAEDQTFRVIADTRLAKQALADLSNKKAGGTVKLPAPDPTAWEKAKSGIKGCWSEMTNLKNGAKKAVESMLAGGGAVGILIAGVASLGKIAMTVYNNWRQKLQENAEMLQKNALGIREAAEANETLRQKSDAQLSALSQLSQQETLSNAGKAEAIKLIRELSGAYGSLGIVLDETTGKLSGVDAAMIKKAEKDKARRIEEMKAEMKTLQSENRVHAERRDTAGVGIWGTDWGETRQLRIGGGDEVKEETQKIEENVKRIMELQRKIAELRRQNPAKALRAKNAAEVADLAKANSDSVRSFDERKADEAFADLRDPSAKIKNRQALIDRYNADKVAPLENKVAAARQQVASASGDGKVEAQKNLLRLERELQSEKKKVHAWERQIAEIQHQQSEAKRQLTEQTAFELQYNKLLLAGEYDKAAALKLERDLKQQNLKLSEEEKKKLLEQQKLIGSQKLGKSIKDQAFGLYGQAMEKAGRGKEFAEERAIREARETKGAELTAGETEKVKKLSALSYRLSNWRGPQVGELTTKTNSLTARGGFAGAVKDNSARVNESIDANTKMLVTTLSEIRKIIKGMGL